MTTAMTRRGLLRGGMTAAAFAASLPWRNMLWSRSSPVSCHRSMAWKRKCKRSPPCSNAPTLNFCLRVSESASRKTAGESGYNTVFSNCEIICDKEN